MSQRSTTTTTTSTNCCCLPSAPAEEAEATRKSSSPPPAAAVQIGNANRVLKGNIPIGNNNGKTIELIGRSWAADSTAFVVPALNLALDAGYPVYGKRMNAIFVTHCHTDHCHHLTHLKSRSKPPTIYLPQTVVTKANYFLDVAQQLTSNLTPEEYAEIDWETSYVMKGVESGDKIVVNKKQGLICRVVHCDHTVPCVGYCFAQIKHSLKPEYKGMPGAEIGKLRKQGVKVTQEEEQPLFCFLGDTSTSILSESDQADQIFSCPTVIIECSFLTDDCRDNAARTKHVLWSDLKPHVIAHPETTFVLTHFSHRWTAQEIANFFVEEGLPNVVPWIPADTRMYCQEAGQERAVEEVWTHS